ncbi:MAG: TonB-dependent receptor [Bacteroidetes bacterium]|nr:TonB-dependent receptor [bacterium]NBP63647.1 TonB-dependent receptor [Bacteroidota bacterium]
MIYLFLLFNMCSLHAFSNADTTLPRLPKIPQLTKQKVDTSAVYIPKQQVVVTGTRNEVLLKDSPVRVEIVDAKQTVSTAMVNLGDLLREQTGLLLTNNVRTGIQMMGLGADYTQILIDGQPMIGRVAGVLDLSRISVGNIDRVEIVKGPMSSLYGSEALAGVINIITKKPISGISGSAFGQYLDKGPSELRGEMQYGANAFDVSGFFSLKKAQSFILSKDSISIPYQGFSDQTFHLKTKWFASHSVNVGADFRMFSSESRGAFIESFFGQIASNEGSVRQQDMQGTMYATWTHGKARLHAQLHASTYKERYNFDTIQGDAGKTDDLSRGLLRSFLQYDVFWSERNRFTFGAEYTVDDIGGTRYPDNPFFSTFSGFIQWEGNPTSWISYALSTRYVYNSAFDQEGLHEEHTLTALNKLLNPKLSINFKINHGIRLHTSIGTGFKVPDFRQLYVQFSNRLGGAGYDLIGARRLGIDLQPERSLSMDVGIIADEWTFTGLSETYPIHGFAECRVFDNTLSNLIEFFYTGNNPQTNQAVYSYRNISRARTSGLECSIRLSHALNQKESEVITYAWGYQYLITRDLEVYDAVLAGRAGTIDPKTGTFRALTAESYGGLWFRSAHSGTFRLGYEHTSLGILASMRAQFIGSFGDEALDMNGPVYNNRKVPDMDAEYVPGYTLLNVGLTKQFNIAPNAGRMHITCSVNNVLNTMNLKSLPNLFGRQFALSFQWIW